MRGSGLRTVKRPISTNARFFGVIAVAVVCAQVLCAQAVSAPRANAAHKPKMLTIHATIWKNLVITVAPKTFPKGTVVFKVRNRDVQPHKFTINCAVSQSIRPGGSASLTVTFRKASSYEFTLADYVPTAATGYQSAVGGIIKVTKGA